MGALSLTACAEVLMMPLHSKLSAVLPRLLLLGVLAGCSANSADERPPANTGQGGADASTGDGQDAATNNDDVKAPDASERRDASLPEGSDAAEEPAELDASVEPDAPRDPDPDPDAAACAALGYQGACDGEEVVYCYGDGVRRHDCAAEGKRCGFRDAVTGYDCLDAGAPTGDTCPALGYQGRCDGDAALWCEGDVLRRYDCTRLGQICRWTDGGEGYDCADPLADDPEDPQDDPPDDPPDDPEPDGTCGNATEAEVLRLLNEERASRGLSQLRCDPLMARTARLYSETMCAGRYLNHRDAQGRLGGERAAEQGVTWSAFGENIARGQTTPAAVHRSWMNSYGHRVNRLKGSWVRVGVGYAPCGDSWGHYWTEVFAD